MANILIISLIPVAYSHENCMFASFTVILKLVYYRAVAGGGAGGTRSPNNLLCSTDQRSFMLMLGSDVPPPAGSIILQGYSGSMAHNTFYSHNNTDFYYGFAVSLQDDASRWRGNISGGRHASSSPLVSAVTVPPQMALQ